jgi:general secretion pathway protein G
MGTRRLDYASPPPPDEKPKRSSWVVGAGAIVVMYFLALGLCVPKFGSRQPGRAKHAAATTDVSMLGSAIDLFEQDTGRVPTDAEGFSVLFNAPADAWHWRGPYISGVPNDPWGRSYIYHATRPSGSHPYTLLSAGPDGVEGTADDVVNK